VSGSEGVGVVVVARCEEWCGGCEGIKYPISSNGRRLTPLMNDKKGLVAFGTMY
jgi:hypothetical protein